MKTKKNVTMELTSRFISFQEKAFKISEVGDFEKMPKDLQNLFDSELKEFISALKKASRKNIWSMEEVFLTYVSR